MTWNNVMLIFHKELLDITRDRRTIISMVVVPLIGMPLLFFGIGSVVSRQIEKLETHRYIVFVVGAENAPAFFDSLKTSEDLDFQDFGNNENAARDLLASGGVNGVLIIPEGAFNNGAETAHLRLLVDKSREQSSVVAGKIRSALRKLKQSFAEQRLAEYGAPLSVLTPFEWKEENIATGEQMSGRVLGSILPYLMILLTMQGGMYAAIDLTAGEKEKATLETLLVSAASRLDIVIGKFLTVMTVSLISALISLLSMTLVMLYGMSLFTSGGMPPDFTISINLGRVALAGLMMLPLAALFASLLLTICIFARSSREAQTYLVPLMFAIILPAMMSTLPGTELSSNMAWVPVVNVSLVIKDILTANTHPSIVFTTFFSNAVYAGVGIYITMKVFQREEVLFKI